VLKLSSPESVSLSTVSCTRCADAKSTMSCGRLRQWCARAVMMCSQRDRGREMDVCRSVY
jgi:hypothetical protein